MLLLYNNTQIIPSKLSNYSIYHIYINVCMYVSMYPSIYLSTYLSIYLLIYPSSPFRCLTNGPATTMSVVGGHFVRLCVKKCTYILSCFIGKQQQHSGEKQKQKDKRKL